MIPLTLTEIWIYPIKSLGGIPLPKAHVRGKGLVHDRRWMLVDAQGVAMTQRLYPEMALFKVSIREGKIFVDYKKEGKNISSAHFDIGASAPQGRMTARVWDDRVEVTEVDQRLSQWFSHHLGTTCKLVGFPEGNPRSVNPKYAINNAQVSLADAYPFLILGQSSLDDLNKKLVLPVPMDRFRPNFVFTGAKAFAEDQWRDVSIGNIRFMGVKKCDRCVLTTVNQDTAEKGSEPLRTLTSYRKMDNKVYFGQNLIALDTGEVAVGDRVIPG